MNERKAPPERVFDQKRFSPKREDRDGFPQFDLTGQVALVTGAARGLGRAISLALAHAGADVALGLRDVKADAGLAAELRKMGRRTLALQMDMSRMEQISRAVDETAKEFGRIDILV